MTTDHQRLRVGLIGAGAMGSLHARVVTQSPDATLAMVVDPDQTRAQTLAARHQTSAATDLETLKHFDALIVAAPTEWHLEWGTRALEAGIPVLIEKPLGDDVSETRALVAHASRTGTPLMCGLLERYNPAVRTALEIVQSPVHAMTVRHSPYAQRIATGVAHDLLIHDVDLVLRLSDHPIRTIDAAFSYCHPSSRPDSEDAAEVILAFEDEMIASLSVSRISQRKVRSLVIAELDRLIEVDMVRQDVTVYRHVQNAAVEEDGPGYRQQTIIDIPAIIDAREPLAAQLERFVRLVRGEVPAEEELSTLLAPHELVNEISRIAVEKRDLLDSRQG